MEQKRTGLSYVFTLAREELGKLGMGMFLAVLCSALSFVPYLVVYRILLLIIENGVTFGAMVMWACIGIAAAILQALLMSIAGICSHVAAFNTMHRIKVRVLKHMSGFNLGFFQEHAPGQIKTTLFDDVDRIEQFLAHSTLELAQAVVVPLMMFVFMLRLDWGMALVMLIPAILGIAVGGAVLAVTGVAVGAVAGASYMILGVKASQLFAIGALAFDFTAFVVAPLFGIEMQGIEYETPQSPYQPPANIPTPPHPYNKGHKNVRRYSR